MLRVLYIDDDADDRELFELAFLSKAPDSEVVLANDGQQGIDYLEKIKSTRGALPCYIVVDLNMPVLNGRQTVEKIKSDTNINQIPMAIFTTSSDPRELSFFEEQNIRFFTKPTSMVQYENILNEVIESCQS